VTISESKLEMPNAFSPNDDQQNDIYRAKKDKYKSIVEFHAYIFNRWGQKLYEWTDITQGWDGTYHGSPVKEGVYFVLVKAKGADGREYNIRKDVNLLRGYTSSTSTTTTP
jgi:gliding motility-associated-like protein